MLMRSLYLHRLRDNSRLLRLTFLAIRLISVSLCCRRLQSFSTSSLWWRKTFDTFSWTRNVPSFYLFFFSYSCPSLILSVKSLIMTISLIFPSTYTAFFVSTTMRRSSASDLSLMLYMVDSTSKVWSTSVRVRTLYPSSVSVIDLLFSPSDSNMWTSLLLNSWRHLWFMIKY